MKICIRRLPQKSHKFYPIYDIITKSGFLLSILPLGAAIQKIAFSDRDGKEVCIALGFSSAEAYEDCICYAGATLGPNAGRIQNALLPLPKNTYQLSKNDRQHQLHGGTNNLSAQLWKVEDITCKKESASLLLSAFQPDRLDGYPGNRHYQICYTLTEDCRIIINYTAWTDKPTYINLSNHTYWNLTGDFSRPADNQELMIRSSRFCKNNEHHLPQGLFPVHQTAFDFSSPKTLQNAMASASDKESQRQLTIGKGYNHAFLLDKVPALDKHHPACLLRDSATNRRLELSTDAPAVVLYSGGYLPEGLPLVNGQLSSPSCAIALEAQDLPDMVHLCPATCSFTLPGHPFYRTIQYQFLK